MSERIHATLDLILPDGSQLRSDDAAAVLGRYLTLNSAAVDLYDLTNVGPHDDIQAVDLLAVNALNAFARKSPMTPMEAMWLVRHKMTPYVEPITREPLETLDDGHLAEQLPVVVRALKKLELVSDYGGGGTRVAKLLHRLRAEHRADLGCEGGHLVRRAR